MMVDNNQELLSRFLKIKNKIIREEILIDDEVELKKMVAIKILSSLIFSKKVFKRNSEIGEFLDRYFNIQLSNYMLNSRTMICGRIIRIIVDINMEEDVNIILNQLYNVVKKIELDVDLKEKDIYEVINTMEI